jgi:hypothetical protein
MKCQQVQEGFAFYYDLSANDERRQLMDSHVRSCADCSRQFDLWRESYMLITRDQSVQLSSPNSQQQTITAVMTRIYEEVPWQQPMSARTTVYRTRLFRSRFLVACAFAFLLLLGCMVYALPGAFDAAQPEVTSVQSQLSVSAEWTLNESPTPTSPFSTTMFAVSAALLGALLLGLAWYNRLRE